MKCFPLAVLVFWLGCSLYFGIGGLVKANLDIQLENIIAKERHLSKDTLDVTYEGLHFANKLELRCYQEQISVERLFPWAFEISGFACLIITALAFGALGAIIGLILEIAFRKKTLQELKVFSLPLLGMLTGLVVLGLSYMLPILLVKSSDSLRPVTLMFLSLLSGIYSRSFYIKLANYFKKISLS